MASDPGSLDEFLIWHTVLPPKLPQLNDAHTAGERALLSGTIAALRDLQSRVRPAEPVIARGFDPPISAISNLLDSRNPEGTLDEDQLFKSLRLLAGSNDAATIPLYVKAQNAGLLIRRHGDFVIFEAFELSPRDDKAMTTMGRLTRSFPDHACQLPIHRFDENGFVQALARHIARLSYTEVREFRVGDGKAGTVNPAANTPTHPGLITDYLVSVLAVLGAPANTAKVQKNTREEVTYSPEEQPWRRSPMWLLIRAVLQMEFCRSIEPPSLAIGMYKASITTFISKTLNRARHEHVSPELLYVTSAKLARRLRKLRNIPDRIYQICANPTWALISEVHRGLDGSWEETMNSGNPDFDMSNLPTLEPLDDAPMTLRDLDRFVDRISSRKSQATSSTFVPSSECPEFDQVGLEFTLDDAGENRYFQLSTVELWVKEQLSSWLEVEMEKKNTCLRLSRLIMEYHRAADRLYSDAKSPSSLSLMYITLAELWIACDTCACAIYPMLDEYSPGIDLTLLCSLSLPFKGQMERLLAIERYAQARQKRAKFNMPILSCRFGNPESFAVRYYDTSGPLQSLRNKIELAATSEQQKKMDELRDLKKEYHDLIAKSDELTCHGHETVYRGRGRKRRAVDVSKKCQKCGLRAEAESKRIMVYEWPLSSIEAHAKATVFELDIPVPYSHWRDATLYFQKDILLFAVNKSTAKATEFQLSNYEGLHPFQTKSVEPRVRVFSRAMPALGEIKHVVDGVVLLTDADVCVDNDLTYQYYDSGDQHTLEKLLPTLELQKKCTYEVPSKTPQIQRYLTPKTNPDHVTPNSVMASVSECPHHMSTEEWKNICLLPLGNKIQYINILTQLRSNLIDFAKTDAHCVVQHIVHTAGSPADPNADPALAIARETHGILHKESFCRALLEEMNITVNRIKGSWETWRAMAVCTLLALRILALTEASEIQSLCFQFLDTSRSISIGWVVALEQRLRDTSNSWQRADLSSRKTEIALLYVSACDVDVAHTDQMLTSSDTASNLIRMSILIRENKDTVVSDHGSLYQAMLQSWRGLLFRLSPILSDALMSSRFEHDLNSAIKNSWKDFDPKVSWKLLDYPRDHWAHTKSGVHDVHFSFLTAELLVNGAPLARLPDEYTQHAIYLELFGDIPIEVGPASEPGMAFSAKHEHLGYQLAFGIDKQRDYMQVVATRGNEKLDLIPRKVFRFILPDTFVNQYTHWYSHVTEEVEFRPLGKPWMVSDDLWYLRRSETYWVLENMRSKLVYPSSRTGKEIAGIFSPLENPQHIHITADKTTKAMSISLIRLRLDFLLNPQSSAIYSCQYTGKIVDSNQCIGTLVGLQNKLVLSEEHPKGERIVLVPQGEVEYEKTPSHVSVSINPDTTQKIQSYRVNSLLRRLEDNGTLQSKLLICYLHALTANFLVDPGTGLTGTEAALTILRSSAVASFGMFCRENIETLELIGNLTPGRKYFPTATKTMQHVQWNEQLPFLTQHGDFHKEVDRLFKEMQKQMVLYPENVRVEIPKLRSVQMNLLIRDSIRSSVFRTDGFGYEDRSRQFDVVYTGREVLDPNRGHRSASITTMLLRDEVALVQQMENLQQSLFSKHFKQSVPRGPGPLEKSSMDFSFECLGLLSQFLPRLWCSFHQSLSAVSNRFNKFTVLMYLSTLAFSNEADMDIIQALVAFYRNPNLRAINAPRLAEFDLNIGHDPDLSDIQNIVKAYIRLFESCPEYSLPQQFDETWTSWYERRSSRFRKNQTKAIGAFTDAIYVQWPCERPSKPNTLEADTYIDTNSAMAKLKVMFKAWHGNHLFHKYIGNISGTLSSMPVLDVAKTCREPIPLPQNLNNPSNGSFGSCEIFALLPPLPPDAMRQGENELHWPRKPVLEIPVEEYTIRRPQKEDDGLSALCKELERGSISPCEKKFVADLRDSRKALGSGQQRARILHEELDGDILSMLQKYCEDCSTYIQDGLAVLETAVKSADEVGWSIGLAPRTIPTFWLQQLQRDRFDLLSSEWKKTIVELGLAFTECKRAQRLLLTFQKDRVNFDQEIAHEGHRNWNPEEFPETLLLEVEGGFLVRDVQEEVAKHMRDPPGGRNAILQLNCGEGKSSVIVPMVAAALADKKSLVRVLVGRPQFRQMLHTLVITLGGLLGRQVFHLPFTRSLKLTAAEADSIGEIYQDCMRKRGVLLVQPENVLSFKLMGIESLINGKFDLAKSLLRTQDFFDGFARDIVDEADENFSVKFELCYTMGTQKPIDLSPERWTMAQTIFCLVKHYAPRISATLPDSIEVVQMEGRSFPRVRLLRKDAADMLLDLIAKRICKGIFPILPIARHSPDMQEAIYRYIRVPEPSEEDIKTVEESSFFNKSTKGPLMLVRGFLAGGILGFSLTSKRWKVNYGLDANRSPGTKLAVPYRSKDQPSSRSEFSHPDVVIALTCLSYYYGGLNIDNMFDALAHLLRSDQASVEYGLWVEGADKLPETFHVLNNVNIEDRYQCEAEIFPSLRKSKAAIDYFLSRIVFAKEIREFPSKLSASGWDLGSMKSNPTTGFSGTNDSRHILPLGVHHLDLKAQKGTNAMVLQQCILQPDVSQPQNAVHMVQRNPSIDDGISDGEYLLSVVESLDPPARVLLDVGAQILDLDNRQVAQKWMDMSKDNDTEAVLFFNDDDELFVLDRTGREELLQTSPFATRLDGCLVYLDEAHTRGIDLRLPKNYRAAVTLGASLTKDRLIQACMRMRKLGKGQSIVFLVPDEIQGKILEITSKTSATEITISDVLVWAIKETCADLSRSIPLWASQGRRFEKHKGLLRGVTSTQAEAEGCLEDEAQTLDSRYRPRPQGSEVHDSISDTNDNLRLITQRCQDFASINTSSAALQEEQERELAPEVEEERQIERPAPAEPELHTIGHDLKQLVDEGTFAKNSKTLIPAFKAVKDVSAAKNFDVEQFPQDLLVTADYIRNVKCPVRLPSKPFISDSYHKPVQWLLSVVTGRSSSRSKTPTTLKKATILVIISPFEADQLLEQIRTSTHATLHIYSPRANKNTRPLDDLALYTIGRPFNPDVPRSLVVQLNLFAGQLYFRSYEEYIETCEFLGLATAPTVDGQTVQSDGFVLPPSGSWAIRDSPVRFLKELVVNVRRGGEGIEKTHLGRMLDGEILEEKDFD